MANALYPKAKELALAAGLNLAAGTVKAQLVDLASYTYSSAHQFLSSIPGGARVGSPVTLSNKSITNGAFAADPAVFSGLSGAPSIEALVVYVDTGVEATSPLIYFMDTGTDLPVTAGATGGTVTWASGLFTL